MFKAIRNPAHHLTGDWNPIIAFEFLGSLSTVARWVTTWRLEVYVRPVPTLSPEELAALSNMFKTTKP